MEHRRLHDDAAYAIRRVGIDYAGQATFLQRWSVDDEEPGRLEARRRDSQPHLHDSCSRRPRPESWQGIREAKRRIRSKKEGKVKEQRPK